MAFWLYAILLFTATHYPLPFEMPGRTDLLAHAAAFSFWAWLFTGAGFFRPPGTGTPWSRRNVDHSALGAAAYSLVDEGLQGIPAFHRVMCLEDAAVNLLAVGCVWGFLRTWRISGS